MRFKLIIVVFSIVSSIWSLGQSADNELPNCSCDVEYPVKGKMRYMPRAEVLLDYESFRKMTEPWVLLSADSYNEVRIRDFHSGHFGMGFEVISYDSLFVQLDQLSGLKLRLNPCLKEGSYSQIKCGANYDSSCDLYYDEDVKPFDDSARAYFELAYHCLDWDGFGSQFAWGALELISGYADYYEEELTQEQLDSVAELVRSEGGEIELSISDYSQIEDTLIQHMDELYEALLRTRFTQGVLTQGTEEYNIVEQELGVLFGRRSLRELKLMSETRSTFYIDKQSMAFVFPKELLSSNEGEVYMSVLGTLRFDSAKGEELEQASINCPLKCRIGKTETWLDVSKETRIFLTPSTKEYEFEQRFLRIPNGILTVSLQSTEESLECKNILLNASSLKLEVQLPSDKGAADQLILALEKQFDSVVIDESTGGLIITLDVE